MNISEAAKTAGWKFIGKDTYRNFETWKGKDYVKQYEDGSVEVATE